MSIDDITKEDKDKDEEKNKEKEKFLANLHPLLPAKMKWDEENRAREGEVYTLLYEKTYSGGSSDSYESSVKAKNNEEAVTYAAEKLALKDALAHYTTSITDAVLITQRGEKLLVPGWSKELKEKS